MPHVEVRDRPQLTGNPGIDDLAGESKPFKFVNALGVGADVYGFGECVVEVKLQSSGHSVTKRELQAVVVAIADAAPGVEGGELIVPEMERSVSSVQSRAGRRAVVTVVGLRKICSEQGRGLIPGIARKHVIHGLRRSE